MSEEEAIASKASVIHVFWSDFFVCYVKQNKARKLIRYTLNDISCIDIFCQTQIYLGSDLLLFLIIFARSEDAMPIFEI